MILMSLTDKTKGFCTTQVIAITILIVYRVSFRKKFGGEVDVAVSRTVSPPPLTIDMD